MDKGDILQKDTPVNIYNEPKNAFVADFIGESNILDGVMLEDYKAEFAGHLFDCVDKGFAPSSPVDVVIRPEDIRFTAEEDGKMTGVVESVIFKGVHYEIAVRSRKETDRIDYLWMIHSTTFEPEGKRVGLSITPADIHIMHKSEYSHKGALRVAEED
jgi:spermidine/putrescine transport system ATP-binding protein